MLNIDIVLMPTCLFQVLGWSGLQMSDGKTSLKGGLPWVGQDCSITMEGAQGRTGVYSPMRYTSLNGDPVKAAEMV